MNGVAKWDPYAAAQSVADWNDRSNKLSFGKIAEKIEGHHETIKRMVAAYYVPKQAKRMGLFLETDLYDSKFNFSYLVTALSSIIY